MSGDKLTWDGVYDNFKTFVGAVKFNDVPLIASASRLESGKDNLGHGTTSKASPGSHQIG